MDIEKYIETHPPAGRWVFSTGDKDKDARIAASMRLMIRDVIYNKEFIKRMINEMSTSTE